MFNILALGGSSWIGHHITELASIDSRVDQVVSTYASFRPLVNRTSTRRHLQEDSHEALRSLLNEVQPAVVMNLWRGESEDAFRAHALLVKEAESRGFLYYYFSSASAVLAHPGGPHAESTAPLATSEYGQFKARCESLLLNSKARFGILRFACAHGVAANRKSRTEEFLSLLSKGCDLEENVNFYQNRVLDSEVAHATLALANLQVEGIIHLGSAESTNEFDFKQALANAFGYDAGLIKPIHGKNIHAGLTPGKVRDFLGQHAFSSDDAIISKLVLHPQLQKYLARQGPKGNR